MDRRPILYLLLTLIVSSGSAFAEVLAEGRPTRGFYWQKVGTSKGIRYLCRSTTEGKIQKASACNDAGAEKPE